LPKRLACVGYSVLILVSTIVDQIGREELQCNSHADTDTYTKAHMERKGALAIMGSPAQVSIVDNQATDESGTICEERDKRTKYESDLAQH
jgi:hypothetical protein